MQNIRVHVLRCTDFTSAEKRTKVQDNSTDYGKLSYLHGKPANDNLYTQTHYITFLVLPFWYLLTRVDPDIFQTSSKTVVCVCVC